VIVLVSLSTGCRHENRPGAQESNVPPAPIMREPATEKSPGTVNALIRELPRARISHRGLLFDLGAVTSQGPPGGWSLAPDPNLVHAEHDGATWAKVYGHAVQIDFLQDRAEPLFFAMRARGGTARTVTILLDGKPVGVLRPVRGQVRTLATHPTQTPVATGIHHLTLRFSGAARGSPEPLAEIDWVRTGDSEEDGSTYAAPTQREIIVDATLAGEPHRALGLRAPASVGFPMLVTKGARLRAALGYEGVGEGEVGVAVLRDGEPATTVTSVHVTGGEHARWSPLDVDLDAFTGRLVALELSAQKTAPGGRILFGDPSIVAPASPPFVWPAVRIAVLLVVGGVDRSHLLAPNYPALADLERLSTTFEQHRIPTTVTAGVMASLLTGLSPRAHALEDPAARLPDSLTTIAVAARDGSVQTAMFTGCPATFSAFGFARGWDKYAAYSPVEGTPATAPLTDAAQWISAHTKLPNARALVVIHVRGGHPPWDVTAAEAAKLPPLDYSGPMEPRRSAQVIARARGKHTRFRLTENDRTRMWAIYDQAMVGHDRAIAGLIDVLKKESLWDETLFVLTGDVGMGADAKAPFGDGEDLSEQSISVPLWVHFPGGLFAGQKVGTPTEVMDLSRTVLGALRLAPPEGFAGQDLLATAAGATPPAGRARRATLGSRYSTRNGDLVLAGTPGRAPMLCDLTADPTCETDRSEAMPIAVFALWRATYDAEEAAQKWRRRAREPATIDPETAAAIEVWGE
jgi:arylsulfatase A-like enzyme